MHHDWQDQASRLDREVADARRAGGFTAVLKLAQRHEQRLQHEWADLTGALTDTELSKLAERLMPPYSPTFEPSPLELEADRLQREMRIWSDCASHATAYAANEAYGWTVLPDGSHAKMLDNGRVLSMTSSGRYEEPDGTIVDTAPQPADRKRHRRHVQEFASRVCRERLARARSAHATFTPRGVRPLARRRGAGRPRAHALRSSAASGDSGEGGGDSDPHDLYVGPVRPALRAVVVPRAIRRYVAGTGLTIRQVRWCGSCGVVAPAIDDYQRQALDHAGFTTTLCPDCEGER